jgi:DNA-binding transcriptional ArsR family regulator
MAQSKQELFAAGDVELAAWAKALSHPARVAVLRVLAERKSCLCGEIVDVLPLAQATVSQHLKALKEAGLVQGTIDGPRSCYCLDLPNLQRAREALGAYFDHLNQVSSCC